MVKKIQDKNEITKEYIKINCVELSEWWFIRFNLVKNYIDQNKKRPSKRDTNNSINKLGKWISNQVNNYNVRCRGFQNDDKRKIWEDFINDPKYAKFFETVCNKWFMRYNMALDYIITNKKRPSKLDQDDINSRLAKWLVSQGKKYRGNKGLFKINPNIKEAWEKMINDPKFAEDFDSPEDKWQSKLNLVKNYMDKQISENKTKVRPSKTTKLGVWLNKQCQYYNNNIRMKSESKKEKFKQFITDPKYRRYFVFDEELWDIKINDVKKFYDNLPQDKKKKPSKKSKIDNERTLGSWLYTQKTNYDNGLANMKKPTDNSINNYRIKWENLKKDTVYSKLTE